jgi:flagellar biosynthetic protein FlhB
MFLIILATEIGQVGFTFATKKFTEGLQFKKIFNPFSGIKKIFISGRSFFELVKSLTKVVLLGLVVYWVLSTRIDEAVGLIERPFDEIVAFLVSVSFELLYKVAGFFIIIAVSDWIYQRYRYREDMKMTKQEVKEEGKQSEGDPKIKARIRQLMRQRIRKLMLKNVQTADVVITNPTHFAVALKYTPGKMSAPQVKAKGLDFLALQIREIAQKNGVPIVEEPPLARTLFFTVEVDQEIPENLFKAVAQILAYVYKLKKKAG